MDRKRGLAVGVPAGWPLVVALALLWYSVGGAVGAATIASEVLAGGGDRSESTTKYLGDTVGESIVGVSTSGTAHVLAAGFWGTCPDSVPPCPQWQVTLTVMGGGDPQDRTFGEHCLATPDYDPLYDEIIPPPGFVFYSYLRGTMPFYYLSRSIKSSEPDTVDWRLYVVNAEEFTISWLIESLPDNYTLYIDDVDMSTADHIDREGDQYLVIRAIYMPGVSRVEENALPVDYSLEQNAPNPFSSGTTIRYAVPSSGWVKIAVYDVGGRLVRTLVDGTKVPGQHQVMWDGRDGPGRDVRGGLYFCVLRGRGERQVMKMIFLP